MVRHRGEATLGIVPLGGEVAADPASRHVPALLGQRHVEASQGPEHLAGEERERDPATGSSASRSQCGHHRPLVGDRPDEEPSQRRSSPSSAVVRSTLRRSSSASDRSAVAPVSPVSAVRPSSSSVQLSARPTRAPRAATARPPRRHRRRVPARGRAACRRGARCCSRGRTASVVAVVAVEERRRRRLGSRRSTPPPSSTDRRTASADGRRGTTPDGRRPPRRPGRRTRPVRRPTPAVARSSPLRWTLATGRTVGDGMTNRMRWVVTVAAALAVLAPALLPSERRRVPDLDLPDVHQPIAAGWWRLDTVVLVRDGERQRLSPQVVGGTDEIVLAAVTVSNAIGDGPVGLERLCAGGGRARRWPPAPSRSSPSDTTRSRSSRTMPPPTDVQVHHRCEAEP